MNSVAHSLSSVPNLKQASRIENRLLAKLTPDEYERFSARFEYLSLPKNRILYEVGDVMHHAYFFNAGMTSLLALNDEGDTIEIGIVGREGFVGMPIIRGVGHTPFRVMTLLASQAIRVSAETLQEEFVQGGKLHEGLLRYSQVPETQMVQSTICNLYHSVEARLCRWLLITQDCSRSDSIELTQENIAILLGKHRNRISVAAGELQQRGLITYNRRGRIIIVDREGLAESACECYRIVNDCIAEVFFT